METGLINGDKATWFASFALALGFLLAASSASAQTCSLAVRGYQLNFDSVDWSMRIGAGQSCLGGFRVSNVTVDNIKLVVPPTSGEVTLEGPGFRYRARADFQGQDSFAVLVSGMSNRIHGSSTVRVLVSVVNGNGPPPAAPAPALPPAHRAKDRAAEGEGEGRRVELRLGSPRRLAALVVLSPNPRLDRFSIVSLV